MTQEIKASDFNFLDTVEWLQRTRQNVIIVIVGKQRSGKSYAALRICQEFDSKFSEDNVCFGMKEFMHFVRNYKKRWIIFDEAGVEFDRQTWWTIPNRVMKYVAETYASRQLNLVMTLPHLEGLLKQTKVLSHFIIRMWKPGKGLLLGIGTDYIHPTLYYKWLQFLEFDYPRRSIVKFYERKKDEFLTKKGIEWSEMLGLIDDPKKKRMSVLADQLGSGLKGEKYKGVLKEYMKLKREVV